MRVFATTLALLMFSFSGAIFAAAVDIKPMAEDPVAQVAFASDIDVGVVFPFAKIDVVARLTNGATSAVQVDRVSARWAGTKAQFDFIPATVPSGESYQVGLKIQNGDGVGRFSHIFLLFDNKQAEPIGKIAVRGFADWIVNPKSLVVDLGTLRDSESLERIVRPETRSGTVANLTRVSDKNALFEAKIVESGKGLSIKSRPHMPWGLFDAMITVETDNPIQKKVGIHLKGEVRGNIVPSMSAVEFGLVRVGTPSEQAVRLIDVTGKKISIGKIDVDGAAAIAKVEDCSPKVDSCRVIKLALSENQMGSAPHGLIKISFPDYDAVLPIPFGAALVGKDTVVRDLEKEVKASQASPAGITAALKSSVISKNALEMPIPAGKGPLLKWEMANETSIFGYEIYRADLSTGPFSRVNSEIIPRLSDDPAARSLYRWRDVNAKAGSKYWYYIGVVYLDGRKEALNSPQEVKAK